MNQSDCPGHDRHLTSFPISAQHIFLLGLNGHQSHMRTTHYCFVSIATQRGRGIWYMPYCGHDCCTWQASNYRFSRKRELTNSALPVAAFIGNVLLPKLTLLIWTTFCTSAMPFCLYIPLWKNSTCIQIQHFQHQIMKCRDVKLWSLYRLYRHVSTMDASACQCCRTHHVLQTLKVHCGLEMMVGSIDLQEVCMLA